MSCCCRIRASTNPARPPPTTAMDGTEEEDMAAPRKGIGEWDVYGVYDQMCTLYPSRGKQARSAAVTDEPTPVIWARLSGQGRGPARTLDHRAITRAAI